VIGGGSKLRSFLLGGIVGGAAAVAAGRIRSRRRTGRATPHGLAAFERAPCFEEHLDRERQLKP
jgi:hypothetical protein